LKWYDDNDSVMDYSLRKLRLALVSFFSFHCFTSHPADLPNLQKLGSVIQNKIRLVT
jgi:hypothetical protein